MSKTVSADPSVFDRFEDGAEARWSYVADTVMGGVSEGGAVMGAVDGDRVLHLTGDVSTRNNGGFIQARRLLPDGLPAGTDGIALDVRGNGEDYFVFIRTQEMTRPWYFYNVKFPTSGDWQVVRLLFADFKRSHAHLNTDIVPGNVISIGLVAYGRDHDADLMVREITLF